MGPLKEDQARFYTASVVLGLEYMQERNIMWRCAAFPLPACASSSCTASLQVWLPAWIETRHTVGP